MSVDAQVYTAPALLAGMISLTLAIYVFRKRTSAFDTRGLVTLLASSGIVSFLFVFLVLASEKSIMMFLLNGAFTFLLVGSLGLLHFSVAFAGRTEVLTRRRMVILGTGATALVGTMWTDRIHHTFRADIELYTEPVRMVNVVYGPTGQLSVAYVFGIALVSTYFILGHLYRSETLYRIQGLIVATAVVLPLLGSALSLVNWPNPAVNLTPVFTVTSAILYTVAVTRYGLLDVVPLAQKEIIDNMNDFLVVTDQTGTLVSVNSRAQELIDEQRPIGRPVDEILPMDQNSTNGVGTSAEEGKWDGEITVEQEHETYVLDVRSVPIHASDGRFLGRAITLRDISELKDREQRLEQQNDQLDQIVSMVSHDLRNPLNVAQMRTAFISEEYDDDDIESIQDSLTRMETIIDDMLTLARSGQDVETTEQCILTELVRNSWSNVKTDGAELDSRVRTATIQGDSTRLLHVFENLFRNAVEHNEDAVTVRVGMLDRCEGFYVEDSGEGIPTDKQDDIFDHGYTTSEEGSGFGLSIVDDIVEAHGWSITVTGSDDGGARFEICTGGQGDCSGA